MLANLFRLSISVNIIHDDRSICLTVVPDERSTYDDSLVNDSAPFITHGVS